MCICQICVFEVRETRIIKTLCLIRRVPKLFNSVIHGRRPKVIHANPIKVIRTKKRIEFSAWPGNYGFHLARDHRLRVQHWEDYPQVQEWAKWDLHSLPSQQITKSAIFIFETAYWTSCCRVERTLYSILTVLLVVSLPPTVPENNFWCGAKCFAVKCLCRSPEVWEIIQLGNECEILGQPNQLPICSSVLVGLSIKRYLRLNYCEDYLNALILSPCWGFMRKFRRKSSNMMVDFLSYWGYLPQITPRGFTSTIPYFSVWIEIIALESK